MRACFTFLTLTLSASLSAQGVLPPFKLGVLNPQPGLSAPNIPGTNIQQVHMIHVPGDLPNVYLCGATISALSATYGGVGGTDVVTGRYDVLTDIFTPDANAAALNTTGTEFGLMLHHTGLHAVFDRLPGLPWLATRTALGQPWTIAGQIGPLPTQSYYDPALATYNGQPVLLHVLGQDIAMTPINLSNGALTLPSVVIVPRARATSTANSPTPVVDSVGELIGLSHHDVLGSDNDHYMSLDLDVNTPSILLHDTATWINNGGFIGGRFFDAESTAPYHTFAINTYWITGGRGPIGGTMDVFAYVPPTTSNEIYLTYMFIAPTFLPAGVAVPPLAGLLGINPVGLINLAFPPHLNMNGEAQISLGIPNVNSLRGQRLPVQSATFAVLANALTLGNTAVLTIQ